MTPWRELATLPRELWICFVVTLVNRAGTMALPFLLLYLTRELHFSLTEAGLVVGAYGVGSLGVSPVAGWLCDRWGPVRVMLTSLFSSAAVMLLLSTLRSYAAILAVTVLWATVNDLFRPAVFTAFSGMPGKGNKVAVTVLRLAANLGMSIGPAVGGILAAISFPLIFYVNAAMSTVAGVVLLGFSARMPAHAKHDAGRVSMYASMRHCLRDRRLLYFLVAMFPVIAVFFQHESTFAHFVVTDLHFREVDYGIFFTISTLLICLVEIPLNLATTHWRHRSAMMLGAVGFAVGFGALAVARSFGAITGCVVVWTVGEMLLLPQATAYLNEIAPEGRRGSYIGLYLMSFGLSFVAAPTLGGAVKQTLGPEALWLCCLGAGLVSAMLLWRVEETKPTGSLETSPQTPVG